MQENVRTQINHDADDGSTTHKRTSHKECRLNTAEVASLAVSSDHIIGAVETSSLKGCAGKSTPEKGLSEHPQTKRPKSDFAVGDYVCIHHRSLNKQHIPCRVVQIVGEKYRLYCYKGIIRGSFSHSEMSLNSNRCILLHDWRAAPQVSLHDIFTDHACLESCACSLDTCTADVVIVDPAPGVVTKDSNWICNLLYSLSFSNQEEVLSATGWLSDKIVGAAKLITLQQFPHMSGLQAPTLQLAQAFQIHRGEFVQIIHVRDSHWCTISNVGCNDGVVNVYDSLYPSVSSDTIRVIASLVFSSASQFVIQMMDVGRQSNGSDCGVLAVAFA